MKHHSEDHQDEEVTDLTADNYHDTLKKHEYVLVNFFQDKSSSEFAGARSVLEHGGFIGNKLDLAKVDANQHPEFVK